MVMQIDLDANASTRPDPRVIGRMSEVLHNIWGNPSSANRLGEAAQEEVDRARRQLALLVGATDKEILFTSGATESINVVVQGVCRSRANRPIHIITTNVEHKAVLETLNHVRTRSVQVTCLKANRLGRITTDSLRSSLRENTALVCLIHGNNEIGTLHDLEDFGATIKNCSDALFFVDASQTGAYCPPDVQKCRVDLMALSAHKMYGPKGMGALYVRDGVRLSPLVFGGGQERGLRAGTLNTPGIVGFGAAAEIVMAEGPVQSRRLVGMRNMFVERVIEALPDAQLNGDPQHRTPGNISLTIPHVESRTLMTRLPHLAISQGSACTSSTQEPSHVLRAIGLSEIAIQCTIRIGFSWYTTDAEIDIALRDIITTCKDLRRK